METTRKTNRMLAEGGIMIALALVLGLLKPYEFPRAGSISLEMLPLFVFCIRWGFGRGCWFALPSACSRFLSKAL